MPSCTGTRVLAAASDSRSPGLSHHRGRDRNSGRFSIRTGPVIVIRVPGFSSSLCQVLQVSSYVVFLRRVGTCWLNPDMPSLHEKGVPAFCCYGSAPRMWAPLFVLYPRAGGFFPGSPPIENFLTSPGKGETHKLRRMGSILPGAWEMHSRVEIPWQPGYGNSEQDLLASFA